MKKTLSLLPLLLLPAVVFARRDTTDILVRASLAAFEAERNTASFYTESPVAMLCRRIEGISRLAFGLELREEEEARLEELGDASLTGSFRAESFRPLDARSALWAEARYLRGHRDNVRGNATADYLLLYPHITADEAGGDLSTEEYGFGGGYARRSGRAVLGLHAGYRAGQEYRQTDPRPHNIVSDFTLRAGFGIETARRLIALDLKGRLYKQNQQTAFFDPTRVIETYLMTGPGTYYARYSGKKERCIVAYEGRGLAAALQLLPKLPYGWHLRLVGERLVIDRNYRPNNSIPVSRLRDGALTIAVAREGRRTTLRGEIGHRRRSGIEMVADRNGQGAIVDRQTTYDRRTTEAVFEAACTWQRPAARYTLRPGAAWQLTETDHLCPMRRMRFSCVDLRLRGHAEWRLPRWRIAALLGIGGYFSPDRAIEIAGTSDTWSERLAPALERWGRRTFRLETGLRTDRRLKGATACFVEARWYPQLHAGDRRSHTLTASCGLLF